MRLLQLICVLSLVCSASAFAADSSTLTKLSVPSNGGASGFDPAKVSSRFSYDIIENIFDSLLSYDYLARPAKIVPNTTTSHPKISKDGLTYTFNIKPGIYFSNDKAFKGKKRELVAEDYAYSIKRHLDKTVNSPWSYLVDGKFVGADKLVKKAGKGPLDYDQQIEGIKALDKYTLQIKLTQPNFNFSTILAMPAFSAVAREAIELYSNNTNANPVGTGPYILESWKPGNKIVLHKNKNYRKNIFQSKANTNNPIHKNAEKALIGKKIPLNDIIEVTVIEEEQPTWLAFLNKQLDISGIPQAAIKEALIINPKDPLDVKLNDKLQKTGISLQRAKQLEITYKFFNMNDPVVGGYDKENIALRRAIAMAFPLHETIARIRRGQSVPVKNIVPEGVAGHNPNVDISVVYNPPLANSLLDKLNYKIGKDGYRTLPDGKPFSIEFSTQSSAINKQWDEYLQQTFDALKIKLTFKVGKWPELIKANREGKVQMWGMAWGADYPDGDNFMQLLYGPNTGDTNSSGFNLPKYNKLYEQSLLLPDGPERQKLFDQMNKLVKAYQPIIPGDIRVRSILNHSHVKGYVIHPIINTWRYAEIQQ